MTTARRATWLVCCLVWSCGTPQAPRPAHLPQPAPSEALEGLPAELSALNAEARSAAVTEIVGTEHVLDPYRALERDTTQTQTWLQAQSERTERALAAWRDPKAEARLKQLLEIGTLGEVGIAGERVFFMLREAPRERPALYVVNVAPGSAQPREPLRVDEPLIDPARFGERAAIDYFAPSRTGRYVAFGVSDNGDERATLRVYDVEQRRLLPDEITHAKWSAIEWWTDDSGFYYRRFPMPGEERWNEREPDSYDAHLFAHRLGSAPPTDALVFKGEKPVDYPSAALDDTGRYLLITNERSWTASDVWLWDRGARAAGRPVVPKREQLKPVITGTDKHSSGTVLGGQLFLRTNLDAPKQRLIKVETARAADRARWQTIVPESDATIEDVLITRRFIVVHRIRDVHSVLELYGHDGAVLGELALPGDGSVSALAGALDHDRIALVWSSFLHAPQLIHFDLGSRSSEVVYKVQQDFPAQDYVLEQTKVPSADGTPIPVYYMHRRGHVRDGKTPVLLTGYGGFDVSLLPAFSRSALYFLERGGIYAQANLRGGGEFGEAWHRAGMLLQKQHVFEDFEAVTRWFSTSGISNPKKIAITGGSNGGLLMGALITRAPETFAAATTYVGLYDMLRYDKFPPASLWTSEYGDPNDPEYARYLLGYSPYHNVREGKAYPWVLIETADHDTRVFWGHSAKFAARLQEANRKGKPIYFYLERAVGHGRGIGIADVVRRYARQYAFLQHALDMR